MYFVMFGTFKNHHRTSKLLCLKTSKHVKHQPTKKAKERLEVLGCWVNGMRKLKPGESVSSLSPSSVRNVAISRFERYFRSRIHKLLRGCEALGKSIVKDQKLTSTINNQRTRHSILKFVNCIAE